MGLDEVADSGTGGRSRLYSPSSFRLTPPNVLVVLLNPLLKIMPDCDLLNVRDSRSRLTLPIVEEDGTPGRADVERDDSIPLGFNVSAVPEPFILSSPLTPSGGTSRLRNKVAALDFDSPAE